MQRRHLILLAGLFALSCSGTSVAPEIPQRLRVASDLDNAPFAYVDEAGKPAGRDVEMMRRLARHMGAKLEWERMPFDELLPAVERGDVDVVCATLGTNAGRATRVLFTAPYFETVLAVVVRVGASEPKALMDLAGKRVAAGLGTTSEIAARGRLIEAELVTENKQGLPSAERLTSGEVDAMVMDGPAAKALVEASGGALRVLRGNLGRERYALALPFEKRYLRESLDRSLLALKREWPELNARHGLAQD